MTRILRDEIMRKVWLGSFLLPAVSRAVSRTALGLAARRLPDATDGGRRLSQSVSEAKLALATRGPALLAMLTHAERDALGRGLLGFHCRKAIVVEIAAPTSSIPFWISDQGFAATGHSLEKTPTRDGPSSASRSQPGWVGLGVNGLDRSPPAHYVVFLRSADGEPPLQSEDVKLREPDAGGWSIVPARPDVAQRHVRSTGRSE